MRSLSAIHIGFLGALLSLTNIASLAQKAAIKNLHQLYDPGLHLFIDDEGIQDHPGFVRKVQQPQRLQSEPVLRPDRPWEGTSVQSKISVLYDHEEDLFKMWYFSVDIASYRRGGGGIYVCYATSKDGIQWEKPELGLVPVEGAAANNIVFPTREMPSAWGYDPWGVIKDPKETNPARRYKFGMYQQRPTPEDSDIETPDMNREEKNRARKTLMRAIEDRHGMYAAFSPDGIHWTLGEGMLVARGGDAGSLVYDPLSQSYLAVTRRYDTLMDHYALEWKKYRRVIALSASPDFVSWSPLSTVLKPDDFDDPGDQMYVMIPLAYGNQYIGLVTMLHSSTELGTVQLASARDLKHWSRVGRRQEFLPVGPSGSWDGAWVSLAGNPLVLKGDRLYFWYSGKSQAHGTEGMARAAIGLLTLRKDGFVALRSGIRGGELMTEPVEVLQPKLYLNALSFFGRVQIRVIENVSVPNGYSFDECNGLERGDETDFEITWGKDRRDLSVFVGKKIRLQIKADNATSLFSYRFGEAKN